mgnify:FL=1
MNNDTAKIVLQADLSKSAAAIAKQLPKLSDEIAQRGKLKIQAVIDPASIQEQAMSAMRQAQGLLSGQSLSLSVPLDTDRPVLSDQLSAWMQKNSAEAEQFQAKLNRPRVSLDGLSSVQGLISLGGKPTAASSGSAGNEMFACSA